MSTRMVTRLGYAPWLWVAAGALSVACGADGRDSADTDVHEVDRLQDDEGSTEVGQSQQGLIELSEEFGLTQGVDGPSPLSRDLASADTHYCFLTRIQGHFQGGGEKVSIFVDSGNWRLRIDSGQTAEGSRISAGARCTPLNGTVGPMNVTSQVDWAQGEGRKFLASADGRTACALNKVAGHFEGPGEKVEIVAAEGSWWLQGSSAQQGVSAGARCVQGVVWTGSAFHTTICNNLSLPGVGFLCTPRERPMGGDNFFNPDIKIACGLGKMSGKFKGGGEVVKIINNNHQWRLHASGGQNSTYSTSAHCFY